MSATPVTGRPFGVGRGLAAACLMIFVCLSCSTRTAIVESTGMLPGFEVGDKVRYAAADMLDYGDVVIFSYPPNDFYIPEGEVIMYRVVGLPGDTVAVRNYFCVIDGVENSHSLLGRVRDEEAELEELADLEDHREVFPNGAIATIRRHVPVGLAEPDAPPVVVPPGHYFLMGDFRSNAADSRFIGPVAAERIAGRVVEVKKR